MEGFSPFSQFVNNPNLVLWLVVKILFIIALGLYLVFPFLVLRQIKAFDRILGFYVFDLPLRLVAWIHLAAAIFIFLLAVVVL
ncbi:hypothetical protein FJZ41_03280 [Candidatus Shapirobacteria bacterium]|nr:hypothetical protein [Candidatus Shapirobacteria bacterium]